MSDTALINLRDFLYGTLSPDSLIWLGTELTTYGQQQEATDLKPYTMEEIEAMIAKSERELAAGLGQDSEEMFKELQAEFAHEDALEYAEAV